MEVKKNNGPYYRIVSQERQDEATIMLYDYIGESYEYTDDGKLVPSGVRDIEFVQELDRLAGQYPVIHLRINSPGGTPNHGGAIVSAIRRCKAEVHTWNDGLAASMAAMIWAAGKERHMAKNAMLMFHSGLWSCAGNPKDMRDCADALDKINDGMIAGMAESTGIAEEEIKTRYFADYADHWLTFKDAEKDGLINAMSEYQISDDDEPTALSKMSYKALLAHFDQTQHPDTPGFRERVRAAYDKAIAAVTGSSAIARSAKADIQPSPSQSDILEMEINDFKDSLAAGTLKLDEVKAHLLAIEPPKAEDTPATPPAPVAAVPDPAITAIIEGLQAQVKVLTDTVTALGQQPGAGKSTPGMPDTDLPAADGSTSAQAAYAAMNAKLAEAADRNEPAMFINSGIAAK